MSKINLTKEQILEAQSKTNSAAQAAKLLNVSPQTYARRANEYGIYSSNQGLKGSSKFRNPNIDTRKYSCNDFAFSKLTEVSAYWLGFLAADGYISESRNKICLVLKREDKEHLEKFKAFLNFTGPVIDRVRVLKDKEYPISEITIYSRQLVSDLVNKWGIRQNKTKKAISYLAHIEAKYKLSFIFGYFDGDGSIVKTTGTVYIFAYSDEFLLEVQKELKGLKIISTITKNKEKYKKLRISDGKENGVFKFYYWYIYYTKAFSLPMLKRKHQLILEFYTN